jgi:leucyl-tRNA synthetase
MQANWIGTSEGVRFAFPHDIRDDDGALSATALYVFTTRADTIMGVTFVRGGRRASAGAARRRARPASSAAFIAECKTRRRHRSRAGHARRRRACRTGLSVTHPLTGETVPTSGSATTC